MKRKTFLAILAIAMVLVLSLAVLTACNNKKHDFSSKWQYDDTSHWHACMTKKHTDVADKADHTFNEGVVTTPATETAEGVLTLTCTVCGFQKTKAIGKLDHVHTFDMAKWSYDDANHWHPATCGHNDEKKDLSAHVWDEGVVTTPATETTEGVKTYTCSTCGKTKTATIGKLDHVHTFDMAKWSYDDANHWHPATCGHNDEKKDLSAHVWDEGVVTTPATETTEGVKTYTCSTCGKTKTATIGKLDHEHTFDMTKWSYDTAHHWHPATCAHTDEKNNFGAHVWNAGVVTKPADYGVEGEKTFTCTTCSATRKETIPATPPKYNTLTFDGGLDLGKTYDGTPVVLKPENVHFNGNGALTIEYKLEDEGDSSYTTTAPKDAGEYVVRARVAATAEWYGISNTKLFTIKHRILTLSESVYDRKVDQNLESGKFGLECKNVAEETNNVVTWITVEVPEQYRRVGIHNMRVGELTIDNPNYVFDIADETNVVRFTVWDAPEFYAGVEDTFTITGRGTVLAVQIANGTVNVGDQLHINELGKVFTVMAMEKSGQAVETATAGDKVGLLAKVEEVTRDEVKRGYTITKPDTVVSYDKVTATIRVLETKPTPMQNNYKPNARFIFIEGIGDIPSTITLPISSGIMPGYTLAGVTVDFRGAKVPAFVGRRFWLIEGGKAVAEGVVTDVAPKTRVNCTVSAPAGKTAFIEPIQGGEKTFALNLNRSNLSEFLKNAKDTDNIELKFISGGKDIAKYTRTPGTGEGVYNEVGGRIVGSYLIVEFYKNAGSGTKLTGNNGEWVFTGDDIYIGIGAFITPASGT